MDFRVIRNVTFFVLTLAFCGGMGYIVHLNNHATTVVQYKGQEFILYEMVREGQTRHGCKQEHKHGLYCPKNLVVYRPVFVEKEAYDLEKWKRRYDTDTTDKRFTK